MLRHLFSYGGSFVDLIIDILLTVPIIVFSLSVHEYAHGWVAKKMGDPTAANLGRLTLNPLKHLDPIGFACMVLFGFGWAKPVPVNSRNFKNPRKGMALTAAAGPLSNLLLALIFGLLMTVTLKTVKLSGSDGLDSFFYYLYVFLYYGTMLNCYLAVFNLLPIPPFDGSRIFFIFLPAKWYFAIMKYERFIMIGVLVLLWTGFIQIPFSALAGLIMDGIAFIWDKALFFIGS